MNFSCRSLYIKYMFYHTIFIGKNFIFYNVMIFLELFITYLYLLIYVIVLIICIFLIKESSNFYKN